MLRRPLTLELRSWGVVKGGGKQLNHYEVMNSNPDLEFDQGQFDDPEAESFISGPHPLAGDPAPGASEAGDPDLATD